MFELKRLHPDAIPAACEKAQHYRLLNEPEQAESICRDILEVDGDHQLAKTTMILALTDQIAVGQTALTEKARELAIQLHGDYERHYFDGLICERRAIAWLRSGEMGSGRAAYEWFRMAMANFERAEPLRPQGTDDPMLRWNSCVRMIIARPNVRPDLGDDSFAADLGE